MTDASSIDLRRAILDTARQLLIEDGYKNLSMRKIAGEIGCSPGTIYLYFKNKDAIIFALIDEGIGQLCAAFESIQTIHTDPLERLEKLCRCYIEFGLQNPEYYEIIYMAHPLGAERYPKAQYRKGRRILDMTADTLLTCAETGLLKITDPFAEATILWSTLHGLVCLITAHRIDAGLDNDCLIEQTIQRAINSFRMGEREGIATSTP